MMSNSSILVFASHDLPLLKTICNKAICMQNGKVVFSGEASEVIEHYQGMYER